MDIVPFVGSGAPRPAVCAGLRTSSWLARAAEVALWRPDAGTRLGLLSAFGVFVVLQCLLAPRRILRTQ